MEIRATANLLCVWDRERKSVKDPVVELSPRGVSMDLQTHTAVVQLESGEHQQNTLHIHPSSYRLSPPHVNVFTFLRLAEFLQGCL